MGRKTVFHSFRANASTVLRNEDAVIREAWIDAVLGHDGAGQKSLGITTYLEEVGLPNLRRTVGGIFYPEAVEAALQHLAALSLEETCQEPSADQHG